MSDRNPDQIIKVTYGLPPRVGEVCVGTITVRDNTKLLTAMKGGLQDDVTAYLLGADLDCIIPPKDCELLKLPLPDGLKVVSAFWEVNSPFFTVKTQGSAAET